VPETLAEPEAPTLKDRAVGAVPVRLTHQLSVDAAALAGRAVNTAHAIAAPATRDFTIDFLRAISILAVAIGHWLVVVPSYDGGTFDGVNALATVPLMQWLSWIFQVMPLFFVVGGFANAVSWRSSRAKGTTYAVWLRTRLVRLVKPTAVLLGGWMVVGVILRLAGTDPVFVQKIAWLVVVPLWFLAVYVIVVALAPSMLGLHARFGVGSLIGLLGMAVAIDQLRLHGTLAGAEYSNFLWVFLFCQQLGFFWLDGRLRLRSWQPALMFAGGITALWLLTHVGPYPLSMVGVPGERIANNAPPTITLIALGIAQAGLGLMLRPVLARLLERRAVAATVLTLNQHAMTILLWHFTAMVIAALAILPTGIVPVFEAGSGAFWLVRIASVVVYAVPLAGLVVVFGRFERRGQDTRQASNELDPSAKTSTTFVVLVSSGLLAAAFMVITLRGLSEPDTIGGVPVLGMSLFAAGVALIRPPQPDPRATPPTPPQPNL